MHRIDDNENGVPLNYERWDGELGWGVVIGIRCFIMSYVNYEIMSSIRLWCVVVEICVFSIPIERVHELVAMPF